MQRKTQNLLDKTKAGNALSLEYHYLAEWEQYQYNVAALRSGELNIQSLSKAMDAAFMAGKLRLACLALSHQAIYKTEYQIGFIPAILSALETETALAEIPALGLYYHCYQFLTVPDGEAHFQAFLRLLDETAAHFPEEELRPLYLLAINYGIRQINRSVPGSIVTTLNLYKGALHYRLLLENSQISRFAFSNIVAIALRAGETDWAEGFIEQYHPHLDRLWRDATASLCLARLEYERGQLDAAMRHLQRADYKDTMNNLTAKTLQMKIFYETNEVDALENHLKNLKNYIRRHTAIGYHRTNYSNIVRFTEQLLWLNKHDKQCVATFRENLIAEEILTEKEWLLKQLG